MISVGSLNSLLLGSEDNPPWEYTMTGLVDYYTGDTVANGVTTFGISVTTTGKYAYTSSFVYTSAINIIALPSLRFTKVWVKLVGGWGQSQEDGAIKGYYDGGGQLAFSLSEGAGITNLTGKQTYSVNPTTGAETLITAFPNQSGSSHTVYVEIQRPPSNLRLIGAVGAYPNADNPTAFSTMTVTSKLNRSTILASMAATDLYYVMK